MTGAGFALWRGSPNHYAGRNGLHVDHITLHIMVGRLVGTDSCFMRSSFQAASHYGVGGDGSVYQWVDEDDGSWADANWRSDCSGITIEHEGGMAGIPVTDAEAVDAFEYLSRMEGIIPAIESAHAVAYARKLAPTMGRDQIIVVNISGRGDKDCAAIARYRGEDIHE